MHQHADEALEEQARQTLYIKSHARYDPGSASLGYNM